MVKTSKKIFGLAALVAGASVALLSQGARADDPHAETFAAAIAVLEHIKIVELANLDFGKIIKPTSGSQLFTVNVVTGDLDTTGTGFAVANTHQRGHYEIKGTDGPLFNLTISSDGCVESPKILFQGITDDRTGVLDEDILIGGTVKVFWDAPTGLTHCTYFIGGFY